MVRPDPSDRLALLCVTGELLVAVLAHEVFQIRRAPEVATRRIENNLYAIDLEDSTIPGWDLGDLLKLGSSNDAWVICEPQLDRGVRRFGLRVGRCMAVLKLPPCAPVPVGVFGARQRALPYAFATSTLTEIQNWPSGVVVDLAQLLGAGELEAGKRLVSRRELSA